MTQPASGADGFGDLMAEGAPLKKLADLMLLGDRYDTRARYAPAALAVAPLAIAAFSLKAQTYDWFVGVGLAAFTQVVLTSLFAHVGRATGTYRERELRNHGDIPMQRWLCPHNTERSKAECDLWRAGVRHVVGLNYGACDGSCAEYRRMGRDAFVALQQALRVDDSQLEKPARPLYRIQQEEYGFGRNLVGALTIWAVSLIFSTLFVLSQIVNAHAPGVLLAILAMLWVTWFAIAYHKDELVMTGVERLSESLLNEAAARLPGSQRLAMREARVRPRPLDLPVDANGRCPRCGHQWSGVD